MLTLKCVQAATTTPSAAAAVLMLAPPGGLQLCSLPRYTYIAMLKDCTRGTNAFVYVCTWFAQKTSLWLQNRLFCPMPCAQRTDARMLVPRMQLAGAFFSCGTGAAVCSRKLPASCIGMHQSSSMIKREPADLCPHAPHSSMFSTVTSAHSTACRSPPEQAYGQTQACQASDLPVGGCCRKLEGWKHLPWLAERVRAFCPRVGHQRWRFPNLPDLGAPLGGPGSGPRWDCTTTRLHTVTYLNMVDTVMYSWSQQSALHTGM